MQSSLDIGRSRFWGAVFWSVMGVLAIGAAAYFWAPGVGEWAHARAAEVRQPVHDLYLKLVPEQLHFLVAKAARMFLTPWLYLLMLIVFVAEKYIPVDGRQPIFSAGFVQDFVMWFTFDGLLRATVVAGYVVLIQNIYTQHLSFMTLVGPDAWGVTWSVIAALLLGDFLHWFHHWLRHKIRPFWLFHTIHHSQRHMNMFTDLRVHLVEHIIAKPIFVIPLLMFSLPIELALWLAFITTAYSRIYHANLRTNYGPLKYFMVTPQSHRVHHSIEPQHMDKNFGVLFSVWDHVFGTQWKNYDDYPATGITDAGFPLEQRVGPLCVFVNYFRQFCYPFQVLWRAMRGKGWELEPQEETASSPAEEHEQMAGAAAGEGVSAR